MNNAFVGALGVVGPRHRMNGDRPTEIKDLLLRHAEKLAAQLGGQRRP